MADLCVVYEPLSHKMHLGVHSNVYYNTPFLLNRALGAAESRATRAVNCCRIAMCRGAARGDSESTRASSFRLLSCFQTSRCFILLKCTLKFPLTDMSLPVRPGFLSRGCFR